MILRIDSFDESTCCGCMACESKCPKKAISSVENIHGFIVPRIDESLCINCGLCVEVCDFKKKESESRFSQVKENAYALVIKDKEILNNSTSGGAFTALSDIVLSKGGYVVGAVWGEDFTLHHRITNEVHIRNKMRGSKYVQSNTTGLFSSVKDYLEKGNLIFFTGTPCQCAGLKSYLHKDYVNLYIMDFLCHGVPNNRLFKEHIGLLEEHYKNQIEDYKFRDKKFGWDSYNNVAVLQNGQSKSRWINQVYYSFFVSSVSLRPSCYFCKYRTETRYSDITVADFWGIERLLGKHNNSGVSLVVSHTNKGADLLSKCADAITCTPIDYKKIAYRLAAKPVKSKMDRKAFWDTYETGGYSALVQEYFNNSVLKRIRFEVRKIAKKLRLGC